MQEKSEKIEELLGFNKITKLSDDFGNSTFGAGAPAGNGAG